VDPGHHVITAKTATAEGKQELDVREGEQKPVEVALVATGVPAPVEETPPTEGEAPHKKSHSPNVLTFVGIGLAGAGVIAGSVTGLVSISKKSSLASQCPNQICGPSSYSALDSANLFATLSDVSFGVAGAGAALAIVSLIVGHGEAAPPPPPPPPPSSSWTVTPWVSGSTAGVRGSF
jgi:hypothetical protein